MTGCRCPSTSWFFYKSLCILKCFTSGIHYVQTLQTDWLCQYSGAAWKPTCLKSYQTLLCFLCSIDPRLVCKTGILSHCRINFSFSFSHLCYCSVTVCVSSLCLKWGAFGKPRNSPTLCMATTNWCTRIPTPKPAVGDAMFCKKEALWMRVHTREAQIYIV